MQNLTSPFSSVSSAPPLYRVPDALPLENWKVPEKKHHKNIYIMLVTKPYDILRLPQAPIGYWKLAIRVMNKAT